MAARASFHPQRPVCRDGAAAIPPEARTGPAPLLSCYVDEPETFGDELDLRPTEIGANVLLVKPFDPAAYERTRTADGLVLVALSQCAVDVLTGSGREPAQAESLMTSLAENESARWSPATGAISN